MYLLIHTTIVRLLQIYNVIYIETLIGTTIKLLARHGNNVFLYTLRILHDIVSSYYCQVRVEYVAW